MPNRIIREGILSSERVNVLSELEELFYRRLMSVVDDYGRYFAHPGLLRSACYPMRLDTKTEAQISEYVASCQKAGLIKVYQVGSKNYLQVEDFHQRTRIMKSKFPAPEMTDTISEFDGGKPVNDNGSETSLNKGSTENDRHMSDICQSHDRHMTVTCLTYDRLNPDGDGDGDVCEDGVLFVQPPNQNSPPNNSVPDKPEQTASVLRLQEPPAQKRRPGLADEEFLAELQKTGAYEGIDIAVELRKMHAWLLTPKGRGRKLTRQFVVNWLNKVDRPMQLNTHLGRSPPKQARL